MRWSVRLSREAYEQLDGLPHHVKRRLQRAIDEFEERDDSHWSNVKALQGATWKGRFRKRVGDFRIIFRKHPDRRLVEISSIVRRSEAYR